MLRAPASRRGSSSRKIWRPRRSSAPRSMLPTSSAPGAAHLLYGGQEPGCAPIVRHFDRKDDRIIPEVPNTIARSIAIGNPADGTFAAKAMRETGGAAQAVTDEELVAGIRLLA